MGFPERYVMLEGPMCCYWANAYHNSAMLGPKLDMYSYVPNSTNCCIMGLLFGCVALCTWKGISIGCFAQDSSVTYSPSP